MHFANIIVRHLLLFFSLL